MTARAFSRLAVGIRSLECEVAARALSAVKCAARANEVGRNHAAELDQRHSRNRTTDAEHESNKSNRHLRLCGD